MKISNKIPFIVAAGMMALTLGICGWMLVGNLRMTERIIRNVYKNQLDTVGTAIEQEAVTKRINLFGQATKDYFLDCMVDKYGSHEFLITKGVQFVSNKSGYQPDIDQLKGKDYVLIRRDDKYLILMNRELSISIDENSAAYLLWRVSDITDNYNEVLRQTWRVTILCAAASLILMAIVFALVRKQLIPLGKLNKATQEYGTGRLSTRLEAAGRDEVSELSRAFNQMADRIENQIHALQEVNERQKLLMGSMAHEWRTPVAAIIGYSDTLLFMKPSAEQAKRALKNMNRECHRLEHLTDKLGELMGMFRKEAIEMKIQPVIPMIEEVLEQAYLKLEEKELELEFSSEKIDIEWKMDRELMESMLVNLLDNAVKASNRGGKIRLFAKNNGFAIQDEGCGIPENEVTRVTEAFYMVDKSRDKKRGGNGLGLAICKEIAKLHKGDLKIESRIRSGTKVCFTFTGGD